MKVRFTQHAIERFIERRQLSCTQAEALDEMDRLVQEGQILRERSAVGDTQLLSEGIIFVLKHDRDGPADCSTVLFDERHADTNALALEIVEFGRTPLDFVQAPMRRKRHSKRNNRWN